MAHVQVSRMREAAGTYNPTVNMTSNKRIGSCFQQFLMILMFRSSIKEDQVAHQDPVAAASTVPATTAVTTGVATTAVATTVAATTAAAAVADATSTASTTSTVTEQSLQMPGSRTPTTMTVVVMHLVGGSSAESETPQSVSHRCVSRTGCLDAQACVSVSWVAGATGC